MIQAEKYQAQAHSLKLDVPENIQGLVDIRFKQLESSIAVDLWQEAFRAIEEIHKLLSISGKAPKASEYCVLVGLQFTVEKLGYNFLLRPFGELLFSSSQGVYDG